MQRNEWLAARRQGISGTDVSAILGMHPYKSGLQVWQEKRGLVDEIPDNPAMKWGRLLEPVIAQDFAQEHQVELEEGSLIVKDDILLGTPDFLVKGQQVGLEVKTAGYFAGHSWGDSMTDEIPTHYMLQCQWYLMLTGYDRWWLRALIAGQQEREYCLQRHDWLIEKMRQRAESWWEAHMVKNEMPAPEGTKEYDAALRKQWDSNSPDMLPTSRELDDCALRLAQIKAQEKELAEQRLLLENEIKLSIGENAGVATEHWKATWKHAKPSNKTDWKKVAEELGATDEVVAKYTKAVPGSRRFLFSFNAE